MIEVQSISAKKLFLLLRLAGDFGGKRAEIERVAETNQEVKDALKQLDESFNKEGIEDVVAAFEKVTMLFPALLENERSLPVVLSDIVRTIETKQI